MVEQVNITCRMSIVFGGATNQATINDEGMHYMAIRNQISRSKSKRVRISLRSRFKKGVLVSLFIGKIPGDIWTCFHLPYFKRFRLKGWQRQKANLLI